MYPSAGFVGVIDKKRDVIASAQVQFRAAAGEDTLWTIVQGDEVVGSTNGEEGVMRGTFSHSIFESKLNDTKLVC